MGKRLHDIVHSELVRNSAKLLSANVIAQAIGLAVYPILTRLYSPEDFGLLNLFLSIGGVLTLLSTAEYQYAVVLPKTETQARAVGQFSGFILLIVSLAVALSTIWSEGIATLFDSPRLARWYWLMPIFVFISGAWTLCSYYCMRKKFFSQISIYQVSQSIVSSTAKIGFGVIGKTSGGLIISSVAAPFLSLCLAIVSSWRKGLKDFFTPIAPATCRHIARKYRNFPLYSLPRAIINNISGNLPTFMLAPFFGLHELGFFGMALTLAFRPLNMISTSLYQTFFQRITERVNTRQPILPFLHRFLSHAFLVVIPFFVFIYIISPQLTRWLLGTDWVRTGNLIRVMLPWLAVVTISASLGFMSDIFQKQKAAAVIEVIYFLLRILSLWLGIHMDNFYIAILAYSATGTTVQTCLILWYVLLARRHDAQLRHPPKDAVAL